MTTTIHPSIHPFVSPTMPYVCYLLPVLKLSFTMNHLRSIEPEKPLNAPHPILPSIPFHAIQQKGRQTAKKKKIEIHYALINQSINQFRLSSSHPYVHHHHYRFVGVVVVVDLVHVLVRWFVCLLVCSFVHHPFVINE